MKASRPCGLHQTRRVTLFEREFAAITTALGRQLRELRDELRVTSAIVLRLDHMWPDVIEQLRAMVQQQLGILDRIRALEEPPAQ